jgi:RHS repeat-associated protein
MLVPNRHGSSTSYRYGFQGQEKDDELKGEGNSLNYTFRMHDPRVGRFFAVDPLTARYPHYSPYSFSGNKVIAFVELEGLEESYFMNNRGFYSANDNTFGEYIGNVKPDVDRYYEIVKINGNRYHKNSNIWLVGAFNDAFGTDYVAKKQYSVEEETTNDFTRDAAVGVGVGMGFKVLGGVAGQLLNKAGGSIWNLPVIGPGARGFVYEGMLGLKGLMRSPNFPVIDAFYKGVATSVKTLDFFAKKYVKDGAVAKQLTKYVDDLADFNGASWGDDVVRGADINKRVLEVGIPKGASEKVIQQITKVTEYAKTRGVELNVRVVK